MPGFSTLALGGTIVSPLRLNYDLVVTTSGAISTKYTSAGITDIVGLQVVIYNNSSSSVTLGAGTAFNNASAYANYVAGSSVTVPAFQSITLITTVVGQNYTIAAISGIVNIDRGAAGNLIYQTSPNRTGFLAAGTSNYILFAQGAGQPPVWNQLTTGNLSGGVAGSLVYQSAPDTTAKSAVGSAFTVSGGGIASMLTGATVGWNNTGLLGGYSGSATYSGGTLTLNACRAYTFATTTIGGSSGNLYSFFTSIGLTQYDGDFYTVFNNTASNYVLTIQNIQNPNSWSGSFITSLTANANQITLYPNETVTFQRYNATYLTIVDTTQSQNTVGVFNFGAINPTSFGSNILPYSSTTYNPNGWTTTSTRIIPKTAGNYVVYGQITNNNVGRYVSSDTVTTRLAALQKNGTSFGTTKVLGADSNSYTITNSVFGGTYLNGSTDYIELYGFTNGTSFVSATLTIALLT